MQARSHLSQLSPLVPADFTVALLPAEFDAERFAVFAEFLKIRLKRDGCLRPPSRRLEGGRRAISA